MKKADKQTAYPPKHVSVSLMATLHLPLELFVKTYVSAPKEPNVTPFCFNFLNTLHHITLAKKKRQGDVASRVKRSLSKKIGTS